MRDRETIIWHKLFSHSPWLISLAQTPDGGCWSSIPLFSSPTNWGVSLHLGRLSLSCSPFRSLSGELPTTNLNKQFRFNFSVIPSLALLISCWHLDFMLGVLISCWLLRLLPFPIGCCCCCIPYLLPSQCFDFGLVLTPSCVCMDYDPFAWSYMPLHHFALCSCGVLWLWLGQIWWPFPNLYCCFVSLSLAVGILLCVLDDENLVLIIHAPMPFFFVLLCCALVVLG